MEGKEVPAQANTGAVEAAAQYEQTIARQEAAMIDLLRTLVNLDSPTNRKDLLDTALSVVEAQCRAIGGIVERLSQTDAGEHLRVRWNQEPSDSPTALILAHLDTVWPSGEVAKRPFAEDDDKLTGPGVFDMKAGLVQALFAIEAFTGGPAAATCNITLLVTSDEETGSTTSRPLIEEEAKRADVVFVVEPAAGTALKTARKGVGMYRVVTEGRAAHAGLDPEQGRSAILELAHQIIRLHDVTDLEQGTTVNVGIVSGGSARNVIPARAEASVDLRVITTAEAERCDALIKALAPVTKDTAVTVTGGINRPPMERTITTKALYRRAEMIASSLGESLGEKLVGGGSDGNFTAGMGVPTLDGLGAVGGGAHALDEYVLRPAVPRRAALLAALLHDVGVNGVPRE